MKPHLWAAGGQIPTTSSNFAIPNITDTILTKTNGGMFANMSMKCLMGYVRGVNVTGARLNSPLLRAIGPPQLSPFDTAAAPPNLPPLVRFRNCGPIIPAQDPFNVEVNTAVAAAADAQALILFGDGPPPMDTRSSRTILCTGTVVQVANAWVTGDLILPQTLPSGTYDIVGFAAFGAGLLAARLIFPTQLERPGVLAQQAFNEYDDSDFRYGQFGVWGSFTNISLPSVEVLGFGAGSAQTFFLDIVPR